MITIDSEGGQINMKERILKLYNEMDQNSIDAVLITNPKHIYYLAGFVTEPYERFLALVMPRYDEPFLLVPSLDLEGASNFSQVKNIYTHTDTDNPYKVLRKCLGTTVNRLGIEKSHLTVQRYEAIKEIIGNVEYINIEESLHRMRAIKSTAEISHIKKAVRLVETVLHAGLKRVMVGSTEMDVAAELEYLMKKAGGAPAFSATVLSGVNSALPHGTSGNRRIQHGDLLLFDIGIQVDGYLSDITRTFAIGDIDQQLENIYETVLKANLGAIEAIRPGISCADLDATARKFITDEGYGSYFMHRLGHGLGIEVHEYPSIHGDNQDQLLEGMVITIEPGIYLPGIGGVRIEDDVVVTPTGVEVLSTFSKELTIIG